MHFRNFWYLPSQQLHWKKDRYFVYKTKVFLHYHFLSFKMKHVAIFFSCAGVNLVETSEQTQQHLHM